MTAKVEDEGPACAQVADGEVYVHDIEAFMARVKGAALMCVEGVLFVLDAETMQWRNVQESKPERKRPALTPVPK
jgi:hypothetical protein